jgi:hypothetical protein
VQAILVTSKRRNGALIQIKRGCIWGQTSTMWRSPIRSDANVRLFSYFAIADISGYKSFLAGVELDHAQDIIAARCELRSASRLP